MSGILLYLAHYASKAQDWLTSVSVTVQEQLFQYLLDSGRNRDMLYLKSGDWTYRSATLDSGATLMYDAAKHCIRPMEFDGGYVRYPWLVVTDEQGMEMSEFFSTLKIARGHDVANDKVLRLFVQQKRVLPQGKLKVMKRNGDEIEVDGTTGRVIPTYDVVDVSQVNFVK